MNASFLASLTPRQQKEFFASLTPEARRGLIYEWQFWARPEQRAPLSEWNTWIILAGRGSGKTRCGAEWVRKCVCGPTPLGRGAYSRLALVAETAADARDVIVEGPAGLLAIHPDDFRPKFERSKRRLTWPNGAVAMLYNATEPDQLRGPQHEAAWCDELAKWRYAQETWDMLQFGLRLGERPQQVITTTPRPIPLIREFLAREGQGVAVTRGSTYDNRANLAPGFFKSIVKRYEGTRLGRQELNAEILDDIPGALWTRAMLDAARVAPAALPAMQRIVIGVDPAAKASKGGDKTSETGIVVAGLGEDGRGYVLDDLSCRLSPAGWARKVGRRLRPPQRGRHRGGDQPGRRDGRDGDARRAVRAAVAAGAREPGQDRARRAYRRALRAGPRGPCRRVPGAGGSDGAVHAVRHRRRRRRRPRRRAGVGAVGPVPAHGETAGGGGLGQ